MRIMYLLSLDDDECEQNLCGENTNCFNTAGSYYCQCRTGFISAGNTPVVNFTQSDDVSCKDINECVDGSITCGSNTNCVNTNGGYYCTCKSGFISSSGNKTFLAGLGIQCVDINECVDSSINCGPNAEYVNCQGAYFCKYQTGYISINGNEIFIVVDGVHCVDINECVDISITCGPNTNCSNTDGGYYCTCKSGFISSSGNNAFLAGLGVQCVDIIPQDICTFQTDKQCLESLVEWIEMITAEELPLNVVTSLLNMVLDAAVNVSESSSANQNELASYGSRVLESTKKVISRLEKPTDTSPKISFNLANVEGRVYMVGPYVTLDEILQLNTTNSSIDIDLIGIAKNNKEARSAAVGFMSFNTMENLLKADFFDTTPDTINTMMSTVISVTLPKTINTKLTKSVNITFRHIREFNPSGSLSCVYWNISEWIDGCSILNINSSYTVCSCVHLSTFALIMQTSSRPSKSNSLLYWLNLVCVILGLLFFTLALLTFALCQWSPGVNNVARINICISLLLAHLLFWLTQEFLSFIRRQQVLCAVISGLLHYLFLSGFVWMFIESVLLFICVKNLSKISSKNKEVLSSRLLCVIGYVVALVVVGISAAVVPNGYGSEICWIKMDKGFIWSFLGPVCIILAVNMILFISISITLKSAFTKLNDEVSQLKKNKIILFKTMAQFVILGCSWILGFFTNSSNVLEILFLILNSQQGTFIFLIYCVLNNKIRQQYRKFVTSLCCGLKPDKINWSTEDTEC